MNEDDLVRYSLIKTIVNFVLESTTEELAIAWTNLSDIRTESREIENYKDGCWGPTL